MKRFLRMLKRARIVFTPSNTMTKTVVLSAIVLSIVALLALHLSTRVVENQTADLTNQAAQLEQENNELKENVGNLGSAEGVGQIAEDELGLVDPDTIVIDPEE